MSSIKKRDVQNGLMKENSKFVLDRKLGKNLCKKIYRKYDKCIKPGMYAIYLRPKGFRLKSFALRNANTSILAYMWFDNNQFRLYNLNKLIKFNDDSDPGVYLDSWADCFLSMKSYVRIVTKRHLKEKRRFIDPMNYRRVLNEILSYYLYKYDLFIDPLHDYEVEVLLENKQHTWDLVREVK